MTMEYDVGQRVGADGTPMIVAADGTQLGGYLPPDEAARPRWTSSRRAGRSRPVERDRSRAARPGRSRQPLTG